MVVILYRGTQVLSEVTENTEVDTSAHNDVFAAGIQNRLLVSL